MNILLIEDDPNISALLEVALMRVGINVYPTNLGEIGVDLARTREYDLILTDNDLPCMNGVDVIREIREARIDVPIIMSSGSDDPELVLGAFKCGADDFVPKPVRIEELIARIRAVARRYRRVSVDAKVSQEVT